MLCRLNSRGEGGQHVRSAYRRKKKRKSGSLLVDRAAGMWPLNEPVILTVKYELIPANENPVLVFVSACCKCHISVSTLGSPAVLCVFVIFHTLQFKQKDIKWWCKDVGVLQCSFESLFLFFSKFWQYHFLSKLKKMIGWVLVSQCLIHIIPNNCAALLPLSFLSFIVVFLLHPSPHKTSVCLLLLLARTLLLLVLTAVTLSDSFSTILPLSVSSILLVFPSFQPNFPLPCWFLLSLLP